LGKEKMILRRFYHDKKERRGEDPRGRKKERKVAI